MSFGWLQTRAWGVMVGAVITTLAVVGFGRGWFDSLWLAALDLQFRHVNRIDASPDIVMIDINDYALERIHRWPWPRRLHAELIGTLHELGASAILMDVVFSEPQPPRIDDPALDPDYDVDPAIDVLGEPLPVFDDVELADAMRKAGCVYPAMFCRKSAPELVISGLLQRAESVLEEDPAMGLGSFAARIGPGRGVDMKELHQRARLLRALKDDFTLTLAELAQRLKAPEVELDADLAAAKRMQARRLVGEYLRAHPQAGFSQIREHFLPKLGPDEESPDREDLLRAYRACRAMEVIAGRVPDTPAGLRGRIPNGWDVTPALDKFTEAARYCGFVTFEKDETGGVLRRIPVLINVEGKLVKQLGFAVACDRLNIDDASFAMDAQGYLTFADRERKRAWRIPLDDEGLALMNWHIDRKRPKWEHSFTHLAVARLMELPLNRRTMAGNTAVLGLTWARAVETRFEQHRGAFEEYAGLVRRRNAIRRGRSDEGQDESVRLDAEIERIERETLVWLRPIVNEIKEMEPENAEEARLFPQYRSLYAALGEGKLLQQVEEKNAGLRKRNEELIEQLRPMIAGKMCFVGDTAAAVADMVNTPVFENMPGVMAHANLVNTVLANRFPRIASRGLNMLLIALSGLMVTLVTSGRGPWVSLASVTLILALLVAGGVALFSVYAFQVIFIVAAIAVFVCWAFITLYRQLTEERQKRNLAKALGRSTSPAIAAEIIRRPGRLDLSPRPQVVTCYFSDLQGFTTISERLGPADTQTVLNRYLERMSGVLVPHHAFTKFMGDGIFAFFNAPLLPVERHEQIACEVAVACGEGLDALKREEAGGPNAEVFAGLVMRAGIHVGTAYVGEYGSENQTDYTCIGDTVNLAARLEPANKEFGTRIMVSQACREAADGSFEFRPLGRLQVKGKESAVGVYELLGRAGEVAEDELSFARMFAAAVDLFQGRSFPDARLSFQECQRRRPGDAAVELYLAEIDRYLEYPPAVDWNQAIRLTTK